MQHYYEFVINKICIIQNIAGLIQLGVVFRTVLPDIYYPDNLYRCADAGRY